MEASTLGEAELKEISHDPKFIVQTDGTYGDHGKTACVFNSIRTQVESIIGEEIDMNQLIKEAKKTYCCKDERGNKKMVINDDYFVNDYNLLAKVMLKVAGVTEYDLVANQNSNDRPGRRHLVINDPNKYINHIKNELAHGRFPEIRVTGHSMNIVDSEEIDGRLYFKVRDQGYKPGNGWTHVDPSSKVKKYVGKNNEGKPKGSHGEWDIGWQMKHYNSEKRELEDNHNYRNNIMFGVTTYDIKQK
ncbi:MAG: hypothetical protein JJT78_14865 [Leptospira sp.]|nr:hypothetical protein [Leptospira sp.]